MVDIAGSKLSLAPLGTLIGFARTTVSSGACVVNIGGIDATVRVVSGLTVAVGDNLLILRHGSQRFAIAKLLAAPPAPPPPPAPPEPSIPVPPPSDPPVVPKPVTTTGVLVCAPVSTATFRDGAWRKSAWVPDSYDTYQGKSLGYGRNTGCAFYGTQPQSLTGATITLATLQLRRMSGGSQIAQAPTLRLVTETTRPAGAPTLNETTSGPVIAIDETIDAFVIPNSWAQALVDGTRGGLAIHIDADVPYFRLAGRSSWSAAWTLTLHWRR